MVSASVIASERARFSAISIFLFCCLFTALMNYAESRVGHHTQLDRRRQIHNLSLLFLAHNVRASDDTMTSTTHALTPNKPA
ncbi:hypothetical protein EJ05DRAFT_255752 [Pseudovirgaria hyperparasitica]|uniref:Uncharacterized protein n=1 Tax=Pseudovirgaria hyperparasitica TaxID=470096 RepID=A0A6A6WG57_9PEZI|nr:uncharacterized protein EJ05DRAFT_255752 [Pseudovirgaria hyperparasitica]KAF2761189.1 hypothetical protein EJ05DRAFT_255752 [Pseudovirgaria hyperparasitica]